jgi:putative ABC transport system permease protein
MVEHMSPGLQAIWWALSGLGRDVGLAARNLMRNTNRSVAAIFTVASGVVAFLLAGGFIAWNLWEGREAIIHSQLGHAQIVRPSFFERGISDPYAFLLPSGDVNMNSVKSIPGVVVVTPRLVFNGLISFGDTTVAFSGEGIDPTAERPISRRINILAGQDLRGGEREVLLGEGLASSLGAKQGDRIVLLVTAANGGASAIEVTVSGVFATIVKAYDDYAIRLPIDLARKLMRVSGATSWVVLLADTDGTDAFVRAAQRSLSASDFQVVGWRSMTDFYTKTEALFAKQVNVVKVIIGLIIVLTISNTMIMSVLERTTEIGTSLAVGLRGSLMMRLFVIEAVLIGTLGGILGILLGYLMAWAISVFGIPMPAAPGMAHGYVARIMVTPALARDAFVLSFITTLLASALPAWKAGRMNIVDALRYSQ